ncbi:MAG: HAMP domain-containing sensor histidine kinase [Acidimicrobiia bacterium]
MDSGELLRELAEFAPLAVLVIVADNDTLHVESASRLVDELSGREPVGSPVDALFPASHIPRWDTELRAMAIGEHSIRSLLVDHLPYGRKWELDDSRTMWQITSHRLSEDRWLAFALDLTGQYRYEAMLEDALEGKSRAFASMGEVVHELRQPVTSIRGFADLILEDPSTSGIAEYVSVIADQARTLNQLIDDLLTTGLQAAGRLRVEAEQVPGDTLTTEITALTRSFGGESLHVSGELGSVTVMADTRRAVQVVRGLIQNAIKYGGPTIGVRFSMQADTVTIDVHDDGDGLTPDEVSAIFEPYTTGTAGSSISSTGIGLAIARSLVTDMGGILDYAREGSETVFG